METSVRRTPWSAGLGVALLAGLALTLLGAGQASAAVTPIDHCPYKITSPGHYVVTQDLIWFTTATAITITASDVVLDLGGHTLTGNGQGEGIEVNGASRVTVAGGSVIGCLGGIRLIGSDNCTLVGLVSMNNRFRGILLENSNNNTVKGNVVDGNGFTSPGYSNILLSSSSYNVIQGNEADNSAANGIRVDAGSHNNLIRGNNATGNDLMNTTPPFIYDLDDDNPDCDSNIWQGNNFGTSNPSCIH